MWAIGWALLALSQSIAPNTDEIVVTGEAPDREAIEAFVADITREASGRQLARWEGAVCPHVAGLPAEQGDYIAETVRGLAGAIGVDAAAPGCGVNLLVIVTGDPDGLVADLRTRRTFLFDSLDPAERARLSPSSDPVRVWNVVATHGADGRQAGRQGTGWEGAGPAATLGNWDTEYVYGVDPSRIVRATRIDLGATIVVIDAARIEGLHIQQLSGFVAMLALARVDIDDPVNPERSILNLFHAETDRPADLSRWDIAYLRALYVSDHTRNAGEQRGQIRRIMADILAAEEN